MLLDSPTRMKKQTAKKRWKIEREDKVRMSNVSPVLATRITPPSTRLAPSERAGETVTNPFEGKNSITREQDLKAKPEPDSSYEERPWTPNTGEDFLLAKIPKTFYPSTTVYPRHASKAQQVVGPRRSAYYADEPQHPEIAQQSSPGSSSPGNVRLRPLPFNKVAPLRDDGFVPIQKKVVLKDHARGYMTEYKGVDQPSFSFASLALTLETEFLEFKLDPARKNEPQPSLETTTKALNLLGRIAARPGPCQRILLLIQDQLSQAIFCSDAIPRGVYSPPQTPGSSRPTSQQTAAGQISTQPQSGPIPYFWLYEEAKNRLMQAVGDAADVNDQENVDNAVAIFRKASGSSVDGKQREAGSLKSSVPTDSEQAKKPRPTVQTAEAHLQSPKHQKSPKGRSQSPKSPKSPKSEKHMDPTTEEKMFEKLLALQNDKELLEDRIQVMALQNNSLEWEIEEKGMQIENLVKETTTLKGAFLRMKSDCLNLRAELGAVNAQNERHFDQLQQAIARSEHERIVKEYELQLQAQANEYAAKLQEQFGEDGLKLHEMMQTMTPRPNWRRSGASKQILVDCNIFSRTDTSASSVDKLLQGFMDVAERLSKAEEELAVLHGTEKDEAASYGWSGLQVTPSIITCMGMGADVPEFLRYNGQVRNLKMRKAEAEKNIRQIWEAKIENNTQRRLMHDQDPLKLDVFFLDFLKRKFNHNAKSMAEWTYNLVVALQENKQDTDCELFLRILMGRISEDVYHDELAEMNDVLVLAQRIDYAEHEGKTTGKCSKEAFLTALRDRFTKTFEQMMELQKALDIVYGAKPQAFAYADLFADDRDLSQNEFAEEFRKQSIEARADHAEQLKKLVARSTEAVKIPGEESKRAQMLNISKFEAGLRMLDPTKTDQDIDIYLRRGTAAGPHSEVPKTIEPDLFLHNVLVLGVCKPGTLEHLESTKVSLSKVAGSLSAALGSTVSSPVGIKEEAEAEAGAGAEDAGGGAKEKPPTPE